MIVDTIMTQAGQDAPGGCDSLTGPGRPGGCCARCGQPDFGHQAGRRKREARINVLDSDRMTAAPLLLPGYNLATLDPVLDAAEPWLSDDESAGDYGPEPYCTECGAAAAIFTAHSGDWCHYRWDYAPGSKPEVYDPGHRPVIGWRPATSPESAVAF